MKRLIEFILSNVVWELTKMTIESFMKITSVTISCIIWGSFIFLNVYLVYNYFIKKERYFAFPITGKILSFFHFNNPDRFVELNIEALKAHLIGWNESYKNIINRVILYRPSFELKTPTLVKYILYFDVKYNKETESTRKIFKEFIVRKLPIIEDEFKNVYKKESPNHHLEEWYLTIEKPKEVSEKYSYVLYP